MSYADYQLKTLGEAYHQGEEPMCPECGAILQNRENKNMMGVPAGIDVYFACPRCGESGMYKSGRNPEPLDATLEALIVDSYWTRHRALCPRDGGIMRFVATNHIGASNVVYGHCPICGVGVDSSKLILAPAARLSPRGPRS